MSNALFPTLPGLTWNIVKAPEFNTLIQRSVNLTEVRASFTAAPLWNFSMRYDVLRDDATYNELKQLAGFFLSRYGDWDSFLFQDPDDSVAVKQAAAATANTSVFQMQRTFGAFTEPVCNVATGPQVYVNNVLQGGGYTVGPTGAITFSSAPGGTVTWSGTYYFRCRFLERMQEFNQFMRRLWEAKQVQFVGSLGTKI